MAVLLKRDLSSEDFLIELSGELDETAKFPDEKPRLSQRIVFDCKNVVRVNSYAIQRWNLWMRAMDPRQQYLFSHIPPSVVNILNVVHSFLPLEATVASFYVPYECEKCQTEELFLARRGKEFIEAINAEPSKLLLPTEINCMSCKGGMNMAVNESHYMRFLDLKERVKTSTNEK